MQTIYYTAPTRQHELVNPKKDSGTDLSALKYLDDVVGTDHDLSEVWAVGEAFLAVGVRSPHLAHGVARSLEAADIVVAPTESDF